MRHIGGGFKRLYRDMEYYDGEHLTQLSGKIESFEHDPNRTATVAICSNGPKRFYSIVGGHTQPQVGSILKLATLASIPVGTSVFKVSIKAGKKGQIALARGAACKIVKQESRTTVIRLPSSQIKRLNSLNTCMEGAVIGKPLVNLGTAGANRRKGIRPSVRGVAMNCCDHPNGGKSHSSKIKNK